MQNSNTATVTIIIEECWDYSVVPDFLSFGKTSVGLSQIETLTIENSGNVVLEIGILSIMGEDASEFGIRNDTCSDQSLAPSESCTFDVELAPLSEGEKNASVEIPSDDPDSPKLNVILSASVVISDISVTPESLLFEKTAVGSSESQTLTITNSGGAVLGIGTLSITGTDASEFKIRNDSCSNQRLGPWETCTFDVELAPRSQGEKSASIEIPSDDPDSPSLNMVLNGSAVIPDISVTPESLVFERTAVGSSEIRTLTITNSGGVALGIGTLSLAGEDASEFGIQNDTCSDQSLAPSETCTFDVEMAPLSEGEKNGSVEIPSDDPDSPNLNVLLSGFAVTPDISVTPGYLLFERTALGSSESRTLTIRNSGGTVLEIGTLSLAGEDASEFGIQNDTCSDQSLAPAETCTFDVEVAPLSQGEKNGSVEIPSDDPDTPALNVSLAMLLPVIPGDVDNSGKIDLRDVILTLQICTNGILAHSVYIESDMDNNGKINLAEAIYVLQIVSGIKELAEE